MHPVVQVLKVVVAQRLLLFCLDGLYLLRVLLVHLELTGRYKGRPVADPDYLGLEQVLLLASEVRVAHHLAFEVAREEVLDLAAGLDVVG